MNEQLIAQWVIDNRYPKSEQEKVSDSEMYNYIVEAIQSLQPNEQPIEELKDLRIYLKAIKATMYVDSIDKAIQALTSVKSESAEEYKTQVVIPIQIKHKNYCDLNGKIIPTEFILDKEHFFYGGYGYIVLHDFANNSEQKPTQEQFNKIGDLRGYLLGHPDAEMVKTSCLHNLGDKFQEFANSNNSEAMKENAIGFAEFCQVDEKCRALDDLYTEYLTNKEKNNE